MQVVKKYIIRGDYTVSTLEGFNIVKLIELETYIKKGYVDGFGAGYDNENEIKYIYIQTTTPNEKFDEYTDTLFQKDNPNSDDVQKARELLYTLSSKFNLPVYWDHLSSPTRRGF